MAKIVLSRIDSRLIHGQVIVKWIRQYPAKRIVIVDKALSKDSFMAEIYMMAAPAGIKVEVLDAEAAAERLAGEKAVEDNVFVLYKTIQECRRAFEAGVPMSRLVVGGVPSAPGKKFVTSGVFLDSTDIEDLKTLDGAGVEVVARVTPEEPELSFKKILEKV